MTNNNWDKGLIKPNKNYGKKYSKGKIKAEKRNDGGNGNYKWGYMVKREKNRRSKYAYYRTKFILQFFNEKTPKECLFRHRYNKKL